MKTALLFFCVVLTSAAMLYAEPIRDLYADTWVATDALGRSLPTYAEVGPVKNNRTVGLFYFLWLGQHGQAGPFDITELLKANPADPQYGPPGAFHHWGKPELGYYTSDSAYVIRNHARILSDAGVDVLIFDVTNAFTYEAVYTKLCEELTRLAAKGQQIPKIMFLTHSHADQTIQKLYEDFYAKNLYPNLWFYWKGKPLILGGVQNLDKATQDFFTIRDCWAWTHGKDTWQWLDHWPQKYAWHENENTPEQCAVCVAEHPVSNIGRSHFKGKQLRPNQIGVGKHTGKGLFFQQQWDRTLEIDPEFIFITGWNEWVAQRFLKTENAGAGEMMGKPLKPGDSFFVDAYNREFSRDIEPMEGGYTDNYYYQMVAGIRKYKGVRKPQAPSQPKTIAIDGSFEDWADVSPEYRDHIGDTEERAEEGWGDSGKLVNTAGRNDLINMKVARDETNLYFYAHTDRALTPHTDKNWMLLFIDIDQNHTTGWEGYDFVVNLNVKDTETTSLHSLPDKKWNPQPVGTTRYRAKGNRLEIQIPRDKLGLTPSDNVNLDFHWADNIQQRGDIIEFSISGDSAPQRRFNYRYSTQ